MPRWSAENRMTRSAFRKLLDSHLFSSMDIDAKQRSVLTCTCGKALLCDQSEHPEHQYREHLAVELEKFAKGCIDA